jgi:hypothetical protein
MPYEKDPECLCCSPGVRMEVGADATLSDVLAALLAKFPDTLAAPSVSLYGGANLYMRGVLEEETKVNLPRRMAELMGGGGGSGGGGSGGSGVGSSGVGGEGEGGEDEGGGGGGAVAAEVTKGTIIVNDKKLRGPLRVKLVLK